MVLRQKKVTESYPEVKAKAQKPKQAVKRKILIDENCEDSHVPTSSSGREASVELEFPNLVKDPESHSDALYLAKKALHTSKPTKLPCRDEQIDDVYKFVIDHLLEKRSGSLYISGAPGTGKTAVVQYVLSLLSESNGGKEKAIPFIQSYINCMNLLTPSLVFEHMLTQWKIKRPKGVDIKDLLIKRITSKSGKMIVLVLDEMDHLLTSSRGANEVLYTIFEWARLASSKLIVIGVANSLDLTVRHLPLLSASSPKSVTPQSRVRIGTKVKETAAESGCQLMSFPPYEREDIAAILEDRLCVAGKDVFDPIAVKYVAGKVAATTGDMRKALNACKKALDTMEQQERPVLKVTADDGFNSSSPKKLRPGPVGVLAISKALAPAKDEGGLPIQQQLILATLLRLNRRAAQTNSKTLPIDGVHSAVPLTTLYDEYRKVCENKGFSWIDRSEMSSVCGMLEDRLLVSMTGGAGTPSTTKRGMSTKNKNKAGVCFDPKATQMALRNWEFLESIVGA